MNNFDQYYKNQLQELEEGKFTNATKALVAAGLMAASPATAEASPDVDSFVRNWSKYYQTSLDPKKEARATAVLNQDYTVPIDAKNAIRVASEIFDGDDGHSAAEITDYLEKTGQVESAYRTKVQGGDGPARSYWQVEPKTAKDLITNSSAYFGGNFKKIFGPDAVTILQGWDLADWTKNLESNDALAATMAAAVWIRSKW